MKSPEISDRNDRNENPHIKVAEELSRRQANERITIASNHNMQLP